MILRQVRSHDVVRPKPNVDLDEAPPTSGSSVPIVVIERTAEKAAGCTLHLGVLRHLCGRGHDVAPEGLATGIVLQGFH